MRRKRDKRGFTLVEVLIVVAISAMLAAITIGYSGVERDQATLSVQETEVAQLILQARSLAIATYGNVYGSSSGPACGYGVWFDQSSETYSIFAYVPNPTPPCPSATSTVSAPTVNSGVVEYTNSTWKIHPQGGIVFSMATSTALSLVLFYPPEPSTLLFDASGHLITTGLATVNLVSSDGKSSRTINLNSAGQVSL